MWRYGGWWYLVRWKGYGPGDDEYFKAFPDTSTYQLDVPNAPANFCFTFHASQLKRYVENDREHFLGQELTRDGPIVLAMADGSEEHVIDRTPTGSRPAEASARPW